MHYTRRWVTKVAAGDTITVDTVRIIIQKTKQGGLKLIIEAPENLQIKKLKVLE